MIRLAVIGGGPKSLFALLALHDALPATAARELAVDVYDPLPPGSGSVWRENQPEVLRLNVSAHIVDASSTLSAESFDLWVNRVSPHLSGEKYPPRALVGRYLQEQFQLMCQFGNMSLAHLPFVVTTIEREGQKWRINGSFGVRHYDEVLLATGHGLAHTTVPKPLAAALNSSPLIGDYSSVSEVAIDAKSTVWVRGAALTAYDVALLLTEGRGGTWQRSEENAGDPKQIQYVASGGEPRKIIFYSPSGRLMDPKTEIVPAGVLACIQQYQGLLRQWGRDAHDPGCEVVPLNKMWVLLLHCAQECAQLMDSSVSALTLWRTAFMGLSVEATLDPPIPAKTFTAAESLRNSLAVNHLEAPVTTGWLWARVWSGLYAELVAALDRVPRSTREWKRFRRVAHNLEKFTFGPPELTARKMVALFDAGILHVAAPHESLPQEPLPQGTVLIDAVTPGPGALQSPAPEGRPHNELVETLLQNGAVSVRAGDRGLRTDLDGTCLAQDGSRSESLAALGRPTEDPTLGHDTLNRSLHREYGGWAHRLTALVTHQLDA